MSAHTPENFPHRFWVRVDKRGADECWPWIGVHDEKGRGKVHLRWESREPEGKKRSVIRHASIVAWELTHGAIPQGQLVCHRCDNPPCCNPSHLFLGTQKENLRDCIRKGRFPRQKLREPDVLDIRALAASGVRYQKIADQFGVAYVTVCKVVQGKLWPHVPIIRTKSSQEGRV